MSKPITLAAAAAAAAAVLFAAGKLLSKRRSLREIVVKGHGLELHVSPFGATITRMLVPDSRGKLTDVALGYDTVEEYDKGSMYFGAIVGRVANRIANGAFQIEGKSFKVPVNNGKHSLHGGPNGFHRKWWEYVMLPKAEGPGVRLTYKSWDGEEGYPGDMAVTVVYRLTKHQGKAALVTEMEAFTRKTTVVNIAQHCYWNLSGHKSGSILSHELKVCADRYTPVGEDLIPTGVFESVAGTPFDFRESKRIGARAGEIPGGRGYDHNFVLTGPNAMRAAATAPQQPMSLAAVVHDPRSGRVMDVLTDAPGMQLYVGGFLDGEPGKDGARYGKHAGLCLETQLFPDAVNQPAFPSPVLAPGQMYRHTMMHRFYQRGADGTDTPPASPSAAMRMSRDGRLSVDGAPPSFRRQRMLD